MWFVHNKSTTPCRVASSCHPSKNHLGPPGNLTDSHGFRASCIAGAAVSRSSSTKGNTAPACPVGVPLKFSMQQCIANRIEMPQWDFEFGMVIHLPSNCFTMLQTTLHALDDHPGHMTCTSWCWLLEAQLLLQLLIKSHQYCFLVGATASPGVEPMLTYTLPKQNHLFIFYMHLASFCQVICTLASETLCLGETLFSTRSSCSRCKKTALHHSIA